VRGTAGELGPGRDSTLSAPRSTVVRMPSTSHDQRDARAVEALRALVRLPTVSRREAGETDLEAFDRLLDELAARFPRLHGTASPVRVSTHGLLFHWRGRGAQRPVVLMAHLDVVPVEPDDPWRHDPFGADVVDGHVWGRGTLDDKGALVALCAAVEGLLEDGVTPAQDVWLSFGCDEEVAGHAAEQAVKALQQKGILPWFVLDEGGAVALEALPGIRIPVAVVGVAEKGVTSVELVATGPGGHASTPSPNGPTARIARAVTRVEATRAPARLPAPTIEMIRRVAPHAPFWVRPVLRRAERLAPLLTRAMLLAGPETAAMARTTTAVTTLSGAPALNVLATSARAGLNVRLAVGDTVEAMLARLRRAIGDDTIRVEVLERNDASPVSPVDDDAFRLLERTVAGVYPTAVTVPYVQTGATDSRHFTALTPRVYRFAPFRMTRAQRAAIHSYDEHLGLPDFLDGIAWYRLLLQSLPEDGSPS